MLEGLQAEQFDEWLAYREIEPDPVERLFMILRLGFCAVANAWGAKVEPKHIDPYLEKDAGTSSGDMTTAGGQEVSPDQAVAILSTVAGAGN